MSFQETRPQLLVAFSEARDRLSIFAVWQVEDFRNKVTAMIWILTKEKKNILLLKRRKINLSAEGMRI